MRLWILSLLVTVTFSAHASMVACGLHPLEQTHASLVWKKFADIQVRSRFADVDGMICVGMVSGSPLAERVTYRDATNQTLVARTVEELSEFQVLIRAENLPPGIGAVIRGGDLVSLKIGAPTTNPEARTTLYPVAVRFHRALARSSAADVREIEFFANLNFERDLPRAQRNDKFFDTLKIFVTALPPRMEQITLKEGHIAVDSFFTSALQRVGGLQ